MGGGGGGVQEVGQAIFLLVSLKSPLNLINNFFGPFLTLSLKKNCRSIRLMSPEKWINSTENVTKRWTYRQYLFINTDILNKPYNIGHCTPNYSSLDIEAIMSYVTIY